MVLHTLCDRLASWICTPDGLTLVGVALVSGCGRCLSLKRLPVGWREWLAGLGVLLGVGCLVLAYGV
ncbi:MAG: hypothetical protein ACKO37_07830 [Vampirovibrionales bacterium]